MTNIPTVSDPRLQEHITAIVRIHEAFVNHTLFDRPLEAMEDLQEFAHLRELYPEAWAIVRRVHMSTAAGKPLGTAQQAVPDPLGR